MGIVKVPETVDFSRFRCLDKPTHGSCARRFFVSIQDVGCREAEETPEAGGGIVNPARARCRSRDKRSRGGCVSPLHGFRESVTPEQAGFLCDVRVNGEVDSRLRGNDGTA